MGRTPGADRDLHVAPEGREESHQALDGKAFEATKATRIRLAKALGITLDQLPAG
jgi:hypothetical protein